MTTRDSGADVMEKRHIGNKYVHCYCAQNKNILVGAKLYAVLNPIGILASTLAILWIIAANVDFEVKLGIIAIFGLPWPVGLYGDYVITKKQMLKAEHSEPCSHKIGQLVMLYGSLWSEFKIMTSKDDGERLWW